ncbi:MAG: hypothetical protein JO333_15260 [Verrucomicrobia bacterium]|nr:hypothetical protein [Verrucomicrobiota bacterium]
MRTRLLFLSFVGLVFGIWQTQSAALPVGKVVMPQLSSRQWAYLRAQEGGNLRPLPIDLELTITNGRVYNVRVRRGTNYPIIDQAIVQWIQANWKTYPWFAGGDLYVVSLNVDPAVRQITFRKTE